MLWAGALSIYPRDHWYHLYNFHDKAFAAQIKLTDTNFEQVPTAFDVDFLDHDAVQYIKTS